MGPKLTIPSGAQYEELYIARVQLQNECGLLMLKLEVLMEVGFTRDEAFALLKETV